LEQPFPTRVSSAPVTGIEVVAPTAKEPSDIDWWTNFLFHRLRDVHGLPTRAFHVPRLELLCAGTAAELEGLEGASFLYDCIGVADKKSQSQRWLLSIWPKAKRVYKDNMSFLSGGACLRNRGRVTDPVPERPDISSGGFPCPPFSSQRFKGGSTASTGDATEHPKFGTLMDGLVRYLAHRQPKSFWLEEVEGFIRPLKTLLGKTPLQVLARELVALGYHVRAVKIDMSVFCQISRKRVFVIGVSPECGGAAAVDWVVGEIDRILQCRKDLGAGARLADIAHPYTADEKRRRRDFQAIVCVCLFVCLCVFACLFVFM